MHEKNMWITLLFLPAHNNNNNLTSIKEPETCFLYTI